MSTNPHMDIQTHNLKHIKKRSRRRKRKRKEEEEEEEERSKGMGELTASNPETEKF